MKTPTKQDRTQSADDAPAERVGEQAEWERVRDGLSALSAICCETAAHDAGRHRDDPAMTQYAVHLRALDMAFRDASKQGERGERARSFLKKTLGDKSRTADYLQYLGSVNAGPTTRAQEADMLCGRVARGIERGATTQQLAEDFVKWVAMAPKLADSTCVPVGGAWGNPRAQAQAHQDVERAFERALQQGPDAKALTRAVLRALGYPASKAKNLFAHRAPQAE